MEIEWAVLRRESCRQGAWDASNLGFVVGAGRDHSVHGLDTAGGFGGLHVRDGVQCALDSGGEFRG